jgi:uncharacterized protein involved in exopolysaccharide biosynthesis
MSHIDEAFKRVGRVGHLVEGRQAGAAAEPRTPAMLERYMLEEAPRVDESKGSALTAGRQVVGRRQPVEDRSSVLPPSESKPAEPEGNVDPDKLVDFRQIADYAGFVAGALGRHKIIAGVTFILVLAVTAAAAHFWPKTYHVQAKLLAQRYDRIAALDNPGRAFGPDTDVPSRSAEAAVLRHDNLVTVIKQTDLLNQWERTRAPILKVKDAMFQRVFGKPTTDEQLDGFIGLLEQRLLVSVNAEGMIEFNLDWPDGRVAYELVHAAMQNFIESRRASETSAITESISILGRSAASLQADIDRSFAELQSEQARRPRAEPAKRAAPAPSTFITSAAADPAPPILAGASPEILSDMTRQKAALDLTRQEIAKLEDSRRQQLSDLQAKLASGLTIYTEGHPTITGLRQSIASVSRDSPQLIALRSEAQRLEAQFESTSKIVEDEEEKAEFARRAPAGQQVARPSEKPVSARTAQIAALAPLPGAALASVSRASDEVAFGGSPSDSTSPSSLRLRLELGQLSSIRDRINGAQIELASSEAAFQYRYSVMKPAQEPRKPIKPNVPAILVAGALGAFLLAMAASVGTDLLSGRIVEPWQLERQVGVPVLFRLRQV